MKLSRKDSGSDKCSPDKNALLREVPVEISGNFQSVQVSDREFSMLSFISIVSSRKNESRCCSGGPLQSKGLCQSLWQPQPEIFHPGTKALTRIICSFDEQMVFFVSAVSFRTSFVPLFTILLPSSYQW